MVFSHGNLKGLLHRFHNQVDFVQVLHGKYPTCHVCSDQVNTGKRSLVESLIRSELSNALNVLLSQAVSIVTKQHVQEVTSIHELLNRFPIV